MKTFKWTKKRSLTCGFTCECGEETIQKEMIYSNLSAPNRMADSSFNQEVVDDVTANCSRCHRTYTIEIFRDNENGWLQVWNEHTASLLEDVQLNVTQR